MNLYNLDRETGALLESTEFNPNPSQARPDPLEEGVWLVPAHATLIEPPTVTDENSVAVFNGAGWNIANDYRKSRAFEIATGLEVQITKIGDIPEGVTLLVPPPKYPKWDGTKWTEDITKCIADKSQDIEDKCDELQQENFGWNGHNFYADKAAQKDFSKTLQRARRMSDASPAPTPSPIEGKWKTADLNPDGSNIFIDMTVGDLNNLTDALYDKVSLLWAKKSIHLATIQGMARAGASAETISGYDISVGW